jgi:hypothetical protein
MRNKRKIHCLNMKVFRSIERKIRRDEIRNDVERKEVGIHNFKELEKKRLQLFGHIKNR